MVFICVLAMRGPGWVLQLVSTARIWNAGGNCTTWRFDTPATRRWKASCSAKPPFCSMRRRNQAPRWLRLAEAWAGLAVCGAFGRFSRFYVGSSGGCNGGNCSIRGATRRGRAVTGLLMLPNPHARGLAAWCWGGGAIQVPGERTHRCWGECGCDHHQQVQ